MFKYTFINNVLSFNFLIILFFNFFSINCIQKNINKKELFFIEKEENLEEIESKLESKSSIILYGMYLYTQTFLEKLNEIPVKEKLNYKVLISKLENIFQKIKILFSKAPYKFFNRNNTHFFYLTEKEDIFHLYNNTFPLFLDFFSSCFNLSFHEKIKFEKTKDLEKICQNSSLLFLTINSIFEKIESENKIKNN